MDEENQNNITAEPASCSIKRKRGRPRKDDVSASDSGRRISRKNEHSSQVENVLVGQFVSGVLDGRFDAGYMLTVTVGNTGSVLTGVVFEPGHSVPISAENDIAPNVQMLKRSHVVPVPPTGHLYHQPRRQFTNDVIIQPKGSSPVPPVPVDLTFKHTPKLKIDQVLVPKIESDIIYSDVNHKSSLGVPTTEAKEIQAVETAPESSAYEAVKIEAIEIAPQSFVSGTKEIQAIEIAPQSSVPETKEIQAIEIALQSSVPEVEEMQAIEIAPQYCATEATEMQVNEKVFPSSASDEAMEMHVIKYSSSEALEIQKTDIETQKTESAVTKVERLECNIKDLPNDFLQAVATELPTPEAKNITEISCHNGAPTLGNENLVPEYQTETTINFFASHTADKPLVDVSGGENNKEILMEDDDSKEGKNIPIECECDLADTDSDIA
ncbi:hypothetical protein ZOSMA_7G00300 [Zostera marina]|uniref:AT hook motif-containing protein n=1 Tax=Zostera marina TaxID=29655 RepID=A0A0K9NPJ1_ZOSMR|nr:hypothetical protein ZOSMA_7G00300 [Zostera marina]